MKKLTKSRRNNNYLNVIRLTVRLNLISQIIYRNKKTIFFVCDKAD
jgi:hypothetical protein